MGSQSSTVRQNNSQSLIMKTYALLAANLLFSAGMSALTFVVNISFLMPWLSFLPILLIFPLMLTPEKYQKTRLCLLFMITGIIGLTLGPLLSKVLMVYANGSMLISAALGTTSMVFLSLSGYAAYSKENFSYLDAGLSAGLTILLFSSLVAMFLPIPLVQIGISAAAAFLFSAYILYDTSEILNGKETDCINATISLYLDIMNLFIHLLSLFANTAGEKNHYNPIGSGGYAPPAPSVIQGSGQGLDGPKHGPRGDVQIPTGPGLGL